MRIRPDSGRPTQTCSTPNRSASRSPSAAHAERLGRVVAGGDEVDPGLARVGHHVLLRLAGQERVVALGDRLSSRPAAPPETIAEAPDRARAGVEHERLAAGHRGHAREQLGGRRRARRTSRRGRSRANASCSSRRAPRRAARCCRPRDGRRAAGGRRRAPMSCLNSGRSRSASTGVSPSGSNFQNSPWWTSTSCASSATARSISSRCALTPVTTRRTVRGPGTWRPFGPRSSNAAGSSRSSRHAISSAVQPSFVLVRLGSGTSGHIRTQCWSRFSREGRTGSSVKARLGDCGGMGMARRPSSARRSARAQRPRAGARRPARRRPRVRAALRALPAPDRRLRLGMVKDHGRAEDITQEVFVSALRRMRADRAPDRVQAVDLRDREERVHRRLPPRAGAPRRSPTTPTSGWRPPTTAGSSRPARRPTTRSTPSRSSTTSAAPSAGSPRATTRSSSCASSRA